MSENHPIWDVHDMHRTARLNIKYYCRKLNYIDNWDKSIDIASAITTPAAVAGLTFWQEGYGKLIWAIIGALTSMLSIAKLFLKLSDKIRKMEEIIGDYRRIEHDLYLINVEAKEKNVYDDALKHRFKNVLEDLKKVKEKLPQDALDKKLRDKCNEEVIQELPASHYFVPLE